MKEIQAEIISDLNKSYQIPLDKRIFNFAVSVLNLLTLLPRYREFDVFKNQLSKSSTSIGANYSPGQIAVKMKLNEY